MILVRWNKKQYLGSESKPYLLGRYRIFHSMKQVSAFIRCLNADEIIGLPLIEET